MTNEEYKVALRADFDALCHSVDPTFSGPTLFLALDINPAEIRDRAIAGASVRKHADCALDYVVEGRPVADRIALQRAAKAGGYQRPSWASANRTRAERAGDIHELGAALPWSKRNP